MKHGLIICAVVEAGILAYLWHRDHKRPLSYLVKADVTEIGIQRGMHGTMGHVTFQDKAHSMRNRRDYWTKGPGSEPFRP